MNRRLALTAALLLAAPGAGSQVRPQPGYGDARMQTVDYHRNQVVEIEGAPGYQVMIALAPDEQIQNIAVGDSGAWQVVASQSGNMLFVRPAEGGVSTNMTVITSARFYAFDLVPSNGAPPYEVRFHYPAETTDAAALPDPGAEPVALYRLKGTRSLRPVRMYDDGAKTYIEWPADVALPAVFFLDDHGNERLANGNMRGALYVIDSVYEELLFRIDRKSARAKRYLPKDDAS